MIRFLSRFFKNATTLHMAIQFTGLVITIAGTGLGIWLTPGRESTELRIYPTPAIVLNVLDNVIGLLVMPVLVCQFFLGYYQHYRFIRDRPEKRRWFTYLHISVGFICFLLGIFNCPSGLTLARVDGKYVTLWWALSSVLVVSYVIACIVGAVLANHRRCREATHGEMVRTNPQPEKALATRLRASAPNPHSAISGRAARLAARLTSPLP